MKSQKSFPVAEMEMKSTKCVQAPLPKLCSNRLHLIKNSTFKKKYFSFIFDCMFNNDAKQLIAHPVKLGWKLEMTHSSISL